MENIYAVYQHIGYKKHPNIKNKLIIDEQTKGIIEKIFNMYANGQGSRDIVKYLNNNKYLSPKGYRKMGVIQNKNNTNYNWNEVTICNILKNEVYIGNTIQNKKTKVSYKVKKIKTIEKEKQIRVNNTHEAIIDKEVFEKVQYILEKRGANTKFKYDYLLRGMLYCHHCKRKLQIVLKNNLPYITCSDYKKRGCYPLNINYKKFENYIIEIVREVCRIYANRTMLEETYKKVKDKSINLLSSVKKQIETIDIKIDDINKNLDSLYNDKLNGILTDIDFTRISTRFVNERNKLTNEKSELMDRFQTLQCQQNTKNKNDEEQMNKVINEFLEMKEVDKSCLFRLIDKIEIDKDKNVFILFNFVIK